MSSYFYLRITFPNPHILLKAKTLCFFLICHTGVFIASGSTHDNISPYQSQKYAIIAFLGLTFFYSFPEYEK